MAAGTRRLPLNVDLPCIANTLSKTSTSPLPSNHLYASESSKDFFPSFRLQSDTKDKASVSRSSSVL